MLGLILTAILAHKAAFAQTARESFQEPAFAAGTQSNRDLENRLLQIQDALKENDSEREKAVATVVQKIDSVDNGIGPKLDKLGTQMELLNANFDRALTIIANSGMQSDARLKNMLDMVADFVIALAGAAVPFVGGYAYLKKRKGKA